jgi:hypothetical protein
MALYEIFCGQRGIGTGFCLSFFGFPVLIIILPLLGTHLSLSPEMCDSPEQAAHYHILSLQV